MAYVNYKIILIYNITNQALYYQFHNFLMEKKHKTQFIT